MSVFVVGYGRFSDIKYYDKILLGAVQWMVQKQNVADNLWYDKNVILLYLWNDTRYEHCYYRMLISALQYNFLSPKKHSYL